MRPSLVSVVLLPAITVLSSAQQPALTVYNQDFAVVRQSVPLDLKVGVNEVRFTDTTAHLEPDSVILRDPAGNRKLQVLEQNYRNDPVSQELLLSLFEGQTIEFLAGEDKATGEPKIMKGKIVRSGYVSHTEAWNRYGQQYAARQMAFVGGGSGQPIFEIGGKLRFGLPGAPLFPSLGDDTILKPTLHWLIETDAAGKLDAELAYVTNGMSWHADYNVVSPVTGDALDIVGWVTIDNQSGRDFKDARIKLMAGDVNRIQPQNEPYAMARRELSMGVAGGMAPPVTEKSFDEYHLYSLSRDTTLRDRETKQVEFVRAENAKSRRLYVYDGAQLDRRQFADWYMIGIREDPGYGTQTNTKVWVMRELKNTVDNGLGLPLPAGRVRFYRRDDDGRLEFTGENEIDHTPKDETIRVYTGNSFDLVGQRNRTDYRVDSGAKWVDESFEIKVRNHKKEPVEIRVAEHLYRWSNWEIRQKSGEFTKTDAQTIEFQVTVAPDKEATVSYLVHYWW